MYMHKAQKNLKKKQLSTKMRLTVSSVNKDGRMMYDTKIIILGCTECTKLTSFIKEKPFVVTFLWLETLRM